MKQIVKKQLAKKYKMKIRMNKMKVKTINIKIKMNNNKSRINLFRVSKIKLTLRKFQQ